MTVFAHRLTKPERLDPHVRHEIDALIASLEAVLSGIEIDPRDPNTGNILYGQIGFKSSIHIQNLLNFPTLSVEVGSNINTFDPQNRVLMQLRPNGANRTINGFLAPPNPDYTPILIVYNDDDTYDLILNNQSSSATDPRDRLVLSGGGDLTLSAGDARSVWLAYSHVQNRWIQINASRPAGVERLTSNTTQTGTDADVNEKDLWTYTIPANTLTANGQVIEIWACGNFANNAQGKRLRFYFGGTLVADTLAQAVQDQGWQMLCRVFRTGSAAQKGHCLFIFAVASGTLPSPGDFFSLTSDWTAGIALRLTGTNSIATANDITFEAAEVRKAA